MQRITDPATEQPGDARKEHIALSGRVSRCPEGFVVRFADGDYLSQIRGHDLRREGCIESSVHGVVLNESTLKFCDSVGVIV
jgi:hypothetical protein